jgi:dienelactone hydrolase
MIRGSWVRHFENHASWSNATLICKGMAPYGAVALGEIDRICEKLRGREGDPKAWQHEWCTMAKHVEELGDTAVSNNRHWTAGHYYLRAGNYYYTGERMVEPGPLKQEIYERALACYQAGLQRRYRTIERVEIPCEGGDLPAYFMKAPGVDGPAPTVVVFDGLDNCKEMSILFCGLEFAERGYHTLSIDGPGQGEALRLRSIHYRHDYEIPGIAAYDYLMSRDDVDLNNVIVMGYSFGGYCAPRVASIDKRYAGCVAFGAMYWDMTKWLENKYRLFEDPSRNTTNTFQVQWTMGTNSKEESFEKISKFKLDGVVQHMECPFLVLHGENDPLVPFDSVEKLFEEVGSKVKAMKVFTEEEGGAQHCQVDDRQAGVDFIADWIAENVFRRSSSGG